MIFLWTPDIKELIMVKLFVEAVAQTFSVKKMFLQMS